MRIEVLCDGYRLDLTRKVASAPSPRKFAGVKSVRKAASKTSAKQEASGKVDLDKDSQSATAASSRSGRSSNGTQNGKNAEKRSRSSSRPRTGRTVKQPKVVEGFLELPARKTAVGEVYVFGNGDGGQLGMGEDHKDVYRPRPIPALREKHIVDIAVGGMHTLALSADGRLYSWGCNDEGALGRPVPAGEECEIGEIPNSQQYDFVKIAAGDNVSFALTSSGKVYGWGTFRGDQNAQLGFSAHVSKQLEPTLMTGTVFSKYQFVDIAAGDNHALALTSTGAVYSWGNAEQGQTGFKTHYPISGLNPKHLHFKRNKMVKVACGSFHSLAIDCDGDLWTFGLNNFGQCGRHESISVCWEPAYIPLPEGTSVVDAAAGEHHTIALLNNGKVLCFGKTEGHELGLGYLRMDDTGKLNNDPVYDDYKDENTGETIKVLRTKSCISRPTVNPHLDNIRSLAVGTHHNIVVDKSHKAYYWGLNINGQLGNSESWAVQCDDNQETPEAYDFSKSGAQVLLAGCGAQHSVLLIQRPSK